MGMPNGSGQYGQNPQGWRRRSGNVLVQLLAVDIEPLGRFGHTGLRRHEGLQILGQVVNILVLHCNSPCKSSP